MIPIFKVEFKQFNFKLMGFGLRKNPICIYKICRCFCNGHYIKDDMDEDDPKFSISDPL